MGKQPVRYDPDEIDFDGRAYELAEDEFAASFDMDEGGRFVDALYAEYVAAGRPKARGKWLRKRMEVSFACVSARPKWIERHAIWPFFDGRPMMFVGQMDVAGFKMSDGHEIEESVFYVFCAARTSDDGVGWLTDFRVIRQYRSLAGL